MRLTQPSGATPERARDVRMLTMLVRSLRDIALIQGATDIEARGARTMETALVDKIERGWLPFA